MVLAAIRNHTSIHLHLNDRYCISHNQHKSAGSNWDVGQKNSIVYQHSCDMMDCILWQQRSIHSASLGLHMKHCSCMIINEFLRNSLKYEMFMK